MAAFIRTDRLAIARQYAYKCTETNRLSIEKLLLKPHFAHRIVASMDLFDPTECGHCVRLPPPTSAA